MLCPQCSGEVPEGAERCTNCGNPIGQAGETQQPAATPPTSEVPEEIKGFNFGALMFNWIWALVHRLWGWGIAILVISFIPFVNLAGIVLAFYLAFKGNELAWKSRHFESVQQFKATQRVWSIVAIIWLLLIVGILAAVAIPNFINAANRSQYRACLSALSSSKTAIEILRTEVDITAPECLGGTSMSIGDCIAEEIIGRLAGDTWATSADLNERIGKSCASWGGGGDWDVNEQVNIISNAEYEIKGRSLGKYNACDICITEIDYFPHTAQDCTSGAAVTCGH